MDHDFKIRVEKIEEDLSEEYEWQLMEKYEQILKQQAEIERLKKEIEALRNRPTTTNIYNDNRTYQWVEFYGERIERRLTHKAIEDKLPTLMIEHLKTPQNLATWAAKALKNVVFCSSRDRRNFVYKNEMDEIIRDPRFRKGLVILFSTITKSAQDMLKQCIEELEEHPKYNDPEIKKLNHLLTTIIDIGKGKSGGNGNVISSFLSELSSQTYLPIQQV